MSPRDKPTRRDLPAYRAEGAPLRDAWDWTTEVEEMKKRFSVPKGDE